MQIFGFTTCNEFQALLELEAREISGSRPIIHSSIEELASILEILETIDVLIVDVPEDFASSLELKKMLLGAAKRIKHILILGGESGRSGNIQLFSRIEISELFEELKKIVSPSHEEVPIHGWTEVPVSCLVHFQSLPFDLYIKLSDKRYVKRVHAYEEVGQQLIDALKAKGVTELYCDKKHNREFSMMLINNMINRIDRPYDSFIEQLKAQDEVFETTKEIVQTLGLSGRVVEVCDAAIEKMCLDVLAEPSEYSAFLLALKRDKTMAFHYKLINLTNYIGTQLILEMKMKNPDEEIKKFVFASFFCDMLLTDPGYHYQRNAQDSSAMSISDQNVVNFHALRASELVSGYKDTPKEVSLIIQQHHGSFSGIGFPSEKSNQLLPLSKILIVSQDLAFAILNESDTPILEILKGFLHKHRTGALRDLVECLEGTFRDKIKETA